MIVRQYEDAVDCVHYTMDQLSIFGPCCTLYSRRSLNYKYS